MQTIPLLWIILGVALVALIILAVLITAAVMASRSRPRQNEETPTQKTNNPYRKFYNKDGAEPKLPKR
jgi:flagellar basal body-associated protein FliL